MNLNTNLILSKMQELNINNNQLAKKIHCSRSNVTRILKTGKTRELTAIAIAKVLKIKLQELI